MFKIDLQSLIPLGDCSTLFAIDNMSVTAYKQGTSERIPVRFTVLNDDAKRALTNDPCKQSSRWQVDINGSSSSLKIAGTDTEPFSRALATYDDDNRQALVNVLAFMMSNSLWASDNARGAFDVLVDSTREEFEFKCELCLRIGTVCLMRKGPGGGGGGRPSFSFPQCLDTYVCTPAQQQQQPCADKDYEALVQVLALLRSASLDNLEIIKLVTREIAGAHLDRTVHPLFADNNNNNVIIIPYAVMKYIISLYQSMSEYADNFAIVDERIPHVKVLIESPSENIGEIAGRVSLTILYGSSLLAMYSKLTQQQGLRRAGEETHEEQQQQQQQHHQDSLANITQLSNDVVIRRMPLKFMLHNPMSLRDWYNFYYGQTDSMM